MMPFDCLRKLIGHARAQNRNRQLSRYLAFIARTVKAGEFLAVRPHTFQVSGIVSAMADNLPLGSLSFLVAGFCAELSRGERPALP